MSENTEGVTLDAYLSNLTNQSIYDSVQDLAYWDALDFFKLLDHLLKLLEDGKPSAAVQEIEGLGLTGGLRLFLTYYLCERAREGLPKEDELPTPNLSASLFVLDKEYARLEKAFPPDIFPDDADSFDGHARQLVAIHEHSKKFVNDLVNKMMKEAEERRNIELRAVQAERERWEREFVRELQSVASSSPDKSKKNPQHTTKRQVLAVCYMLKYLQVKNVDKTVQAQFIEFLTGKNSKKIYDSVREFEDIVLIKGGEDARYVKGWFEKLGLTEIVKEIEALLDKKSEKF